MQFERLKRKLLSCFERAHKHQQSTIDNVLLSLFRFCHGKRKIQFRLRFHRPVRINVGQTTFLCNSIIRLLYVDHVWWATGHDKLKFKILHSRPMEFILRIGILNQATHTMTEMHRKEFTAVKKILVFSLSFVVSNAVANVTSYTDDLLIRNWHDSGKVVGHVLHECSSSRRSTYRPVWKWKM